MWSEPHEWKNNNADNNDVLGVLLLLFLLIQCVIWCSHLVVARFIVLLEFHNQFLCFILCSRLDCFRLLMSIMCLLCVVIPFSSLFSSSLGLLKKQWMVCVCYPLSIERRADRFNTMPHWKTQIQNIKIAGARATASFNKPIQRFIVESDFTFFGHRRSNWLEIHLFQF